MKITKLEFKSVKPNWTLLQYHSSDDPVRQVNEASLADLDEQGWWHIPTLRHQDDESVGDW